MVQTPTSKVTLEAFLRLSETESASGYIEGRIFQKPMPQGQHSIIQGELVSEINRVLKRSRIAFKRSLNFHLSMNPEP